MSITDDVRVVPGHDRDGGPGEPAFDRTPPQDMAAEQCVLGGMLLSKDAIADVVEILRSADFYRPAHATIFDTVLDLYGRGEPADPITVAAALTAAGDLGRVGGGPYLHTLISSVPTAANSAYYAKIVAERAVLRRLVEAGTRIVAMGYGSAAGQGRDVDDIVDLAQQAVYDVTERRAGDGRGHRQCRGRGLGPRDGFTAVSRSAAAAGPARGNAALPDRSRRGRPGDELRSAHLAADGEGAR